MRKNAGVWEELCLFKRKYFDIRNKKTGINLPSSGEVTPHPTPALLESFPQIISVRGGQVNWFGRIRPRGDDATLKFREYVSNVAPRNANQGGIFYLI